MLYLKKNLEHTIQNRPDFIGSYSDFCPTMSVKTHEILCERCCYDLHGLLQVISFFAVVRNRIETLPVLHMASFYVYR